MDLNPGAAQIASNGRRFDRVLAQRAVTMLVVGALVALLLPTAALASTGATRLAFGVQPTTTVAGSAISSFTVRVEADDGTLDTTSSAAVQVALLANPGGGTLTGTTSVAAAGGIATFTGLSIDKAGVGYTLVATSSGLSGATSASFTIVGAATKLAFAGAPSSGTAGSTLGSVTVQVQDANGSLVTSSSALVTIAIGTNPGSGTLSGTTSATAVNGVATFADLSIDKAGVGYTLVATSSGLSGATSASFTVVGAATKLAFTSTPASTIAGSSLGVLTVQVQDANGSPVSTSSALVTLAIGTNPGGGSLSGTTTATAANGIATFSNLSINTAGVGYTLVATSSGLTGATSATFTITAGTATKLQFATQPGGGTAGATWSQQPVVAVVNSLGQVVTSDSSTVVTLAIGTNPTSGTLSCSSGTSVTAVNGYATFYGCSIDLGTSSSYYTLTATSSPYRSPASSAAFYVTGSGSYLAFVTQPGGGTAGATWSQQPLVAVVNSLGQVVTSDDSTVVSLSMGTNAAGGTLSCSSGTSVTAVNGYASFYGCSIDLGTSSSYYTLVASSSPYLTPTTSDPFYVTGSGSYLAFATQPGGGTAGATWSQQPVVAVVNSLGQVVTSDSSTVVTLAIGTNPTSGTLSCSSGTSVTAVNGYATFYGCSIDLGTSSSYYTLTATSSPYRIPVTSSGFSVTGAKSSVTLSVGSAVGRTTSGFSTSTKVVKSSTWVTIRIQTSTALAGKTVGIWMATKQADGTWSDYKPHVRVVVNADGVAYYRYRITSKSVRAFIAVYKGDTTIAAAQSSRVVVRWR